MLKKKKCCTTVFRMDCQQGPNITHGTLPNVLWWLGREESLRENGYMGMYG